VLIITCAVLWLAGHYKDIPSALRNRDVIIFFLIAVIPLATLIYSNEYPFSHFEKRLSFFLFPLIFATTDISKQTITRILYSFSISCTIASLYIIVTSITQIMDDYYTTEVALEAIGTSHVYFGMYLTFSVIATTYLVLNRPIRTIISFLLIAAIIIQLIFLIMLGAKMAIITLFLLCMIVGVVYVIRTRRWTMGMIMLAVPIITFAVLFRYFESVSHRFTDLLNPDNYFVDDNAWNSIGVRVSILKCTFETYMKAPILGTGLGDQQSALNACYASYNFITLNDYNTHNQYLQFLLGAGILGLVAFLFLLAYAAVHAWKQKKELYFYFLFVVAMCCLTESILERQHGIMFFAFFSSMFFFSFASGKETEASKGELQPV
jgi:O-antigen ligase